jgi:hypothetical protein
MPDATEAMTLRSIILFGLPVVCMLAAVYAWHWWTTPPCIQFFSLHSAELSRCSRDLIMERDSLPDKFPLPEIIERSKVNLVDLHKDSIDFTYYRWYTFPDGPMDHLVYVKSGMSTDAVRNLDYIRKPIHQVKRLSENWFYVETE